MNNFNFEVPKIETMHGSEVGSIFLIIAKANGLKMGVRFFSQTAHLEKVEWASLVARLRVVSTIDADVSISTAKEVFGNFPFTKGKGKHCSNVAVLPLAKAPCTYQTAREAYLKLENVEGTFLDAIEKRLPSGVSFCIPKEFIVSALKEKVEDLIPEIKIVYPETKEFIWLEE